MIAWMTKEWSDKEIDQMIEVYKAWWQGGKIDLRHYTKQVREWAREEGYADNSRTAVQIVIGLDLPAECVWRMIKPYIDECTSFSIVRTAKRLWDFLNFWCELEPRIKQIEELLLNLDWEGYITFQACGEIWRIDIPNRA